MDVTRRIKKEEELKKSIRNTLTYNKLV
jgi:hypothetical protein